MAPPQSQSQRPFRRRLRRLMRPTFGAAKTGKTAHAAKAPGKRRRVPRVSRTERPVPNSLPLVAQTCGTGMPRSLLRYSAPSRQMGGRRTFGACRSVSSERSEPPLPSPPPSIAGRAGKRAAACLSGGSEATIASSADPGPTETRRGPVRRLRQQPWDRRRRKEMVARDGSIASAKYAGFMPAIQPPRAAR